MNKSHIVTTPLGSLLFEVNALSGDLSTASIRAMPMEVSIPSNMTVENSIAVFLHLNSPPPITDLKFLCSWIQPQVQGFPCSGEGLDAWEWENNSNLVIVGTEDEDLMRARLNHSKHQNDKYPVSLENNCVHIEINSYPNCKELSLHYIVSWNPLPEKKENSCWFAVDVKHEYVKEAFPKLV